MRVVLIEIRNFRGIKELAWTPSPKINCLIGPGDSTKTTILDAIELALTPRSYIFADDSDFYDLAVDQTIEITLTLAGLPAEFVTEDGYGLLLRGWDPAKAKLYDESGKGLEEALSIRLAIDKTLEARWSIYNDRLVKDVDPPAVRYKHAQLITPTRLGPYAERHLGWGRQSILSKMGAARENLSNQVAEARRAAKAAFSNDKETPFQTTAAKAQTLAKKFSVRVRNKFTAELDVEGINITTGGIALHDNKLPLRCLGTGSARLIVSALQHSTGNAHIALVDEIEHGLEPHRIARLLKFLAAPYDGQENGPASQTFMTTHSPVVIRELAAADLFTVRVSGAKIVVEPVGTSGFETDRIQAHVRAAPEAFLANRILIGEGRTECGLARGMDAWWCDQKKESFALHGVVAVGGDGNTKAPTLALHLLKLGYGVGLLLDTDEKVPAETLARVTEAGGVVFEWPDACSTEERLFRDVPWAKVKELIELAVDFAGVDSVCAKINAACKDAGIEAIKDLSLPNGLDNEDFRKALGAAAKKKTKNGSAPWFKTVTAGEKVAAIVAPALAQIAASPTATVISNIRGWVDVA
jgi:putative ATP-dependent endonuclease of the OLD family